MKAVSVILLVASTTTAGDVFVIGNSLTWDMQRQLSPRIEVGAHIVSSQELGVVLARSPEIARGADDWLAAATSGEWAAYTVQPFGDETIEDTAAAIELVKAETGRQVYVYAAFPFRNQFDRWNDPYDSGIYEAKAAYHEALLAMVDDVKLIPAAHVAQRVVADGILTVDDLYRDQIHASYGPGADLLADTAWATINDAYPIWSPYAPQIWEQLHPATVPEPDQIALALFAGLLLKRGSRRAADN